MTAKNKIRVAVLYGGMSGEHEISLISASSVLRNLDRTQFDLLAVSIDKKGKWLLHDAAALIATAPKSLPVEGMKGENATEVLLVPMKLPTGYAFRSIDGSKTFPVDVVFPVMHGPLCEDGSIQGLLELAGVPFVGCGVLSSSVSMDKEFTKRLVAAAGVPMVPYIAAVKGRWDAEKTGITQRVGLELGYPVFVKPANLGSSVGVHKVKEEKELAAAVKDAFRYDEKVLIEKFIPAREIELSALEGETPSDPPRISIAGEIVPTHEFYSYEAKYLDENGARLLLPAKLDELQMKHAQTLAARVFQTLNCEGMARIDLFLDKITGEFYLNEINTIPGFTQISMYPKLWEASGLKYGPLLTELVRLARARAERKAALVRDWKA